MTLAFRIGLALYSVILGTIGTLAYMGRLPSLLGGVPHYDTIGHAVLIGTFSLLLDGSLGFSPLPWPNRQYLPLAPVLVLVLAGAEELLQSFSPVRTCSLSDYAADVVGIALLAFIVRIPLIRRARSRPGTPDPDPRS